MAEEVVLVTYCAIMEFLGGVVEILGSGGGNSCPPSEARASIESKLVTRP